MLLKEILNLDGKIFNCIEGRTSSFSVNKILIQENIKEDCVLCVIFYSKSTKVQAIFKLLEQEYIESDFTYNEEGPIEKIYSNLDN